MKLLYKTVPLILVTVGLLFVGIAGVELLSSHQSQQKELQEAEHDYNEETLTVTTCFPFGYVGDAPNRYIITAKRASNLIGDK
ncbi:hypothetical protein JOC85_003297 [Bacillus mesophilus]|uniref:Uncharacterized protein n=1 Tax=Bacillus mesophilus TaxID=1808955 RepID=A0A6M0Q958_9BACI|nr:hypothetical protein [Bacillus mesophilus]MBM7662490.1 hypothetical protein [Bacillus mesophilus]NEY72884.1 hypothetical protein [Bacillus mesophilus]